MFAQVKQLPFEKPNYVSEKGSQYFFSEKGVFRKSNHWGRVGNCRWKIHALNYKAQEMIIGYAAWQDFFSINGYDSLYFILHTENGFDYFHKNDKIYQKEFILRTAGQTAKILQQLKEIETIPAWFDYFSDTNENLIEFFSKGLINSNKSLSQLKILKKQQEG